MRCEDTERELAQPRLAPSPRRGAGPPSRVCGTIPRVARRGPLISPLLEALLVRIHATNATRVRGRVVKSSTLNFTALVVGACGQVLT